MSKLRHSKQRLAKYFIDESNSVVKLLGETFGGVRLSASGDSRGIEARGIALRTDIVSEQLCDDIVGYLAPTLEQHKGCTILDVHPGACLLSSKLHDFLKPKRHILMEPEKRYHEPFIKPLLEKPDSTYRWTDLTGAHPSNYWANYRTVLDDPQLCEPRKELALDDPARRKLDPSMLLIGNLTRRYTVRDKGYGSVYWNTVMLQMGNASLTNDMFHRDGLVRMLWWLPEHEKSFYFPTTELWRQNFQAALSLAADTSEVVGTLRPQARDNRIRIGRPDMIEELVAEWAQQSARDRGMSLPEGRELLGFDAVDKLSATEVVSPLKIVSNSLETLESETDVAYMLLEKLHQASRRPRRPDPLIPTFIFDFPQVIPLAERRVLNKPLGGGHDRVAAHLELLLRTVRLEASFAALEESLQQEVTENDAETAQGKSVMTPNSLQAQAACAGDSSSTDEPSQIAHSTDGEQGQHSAAERLQRLRERILRFDQEHLEAMAVRGAEFCYFLETMAEEQVSTFAIRPLLQRERRSYEPLKASPSEFWPRSELMLIDMVPSSRDISVPGLADAFEARKVCHEILKKLFEKRSLFLPESLAFLAPNAAQDLIPKVPDFHDARKGGRMDPRRLRVRMLTDDMVEALVKAFIEWPFRPSTLELELSSASSSGAEEGSSEAFGVGDSSN